ncbi:MAG TPA: class I SAM-dependent methyltransferase, partial [Ktedonobacteraceae bacterium]|nr:class I SAM-dependent methyltransferase [Ktedonobacteraceae bacterium]
MDDNARPDLSSEPEVEIASKLFDSLYTATNQSPTLRQIWRTIYGDDYPEGTDPFSFVTLTDLQRFASSLHVQAGQTFADLACGSGGPGLWVARQTGASLIGLDFSRVAIEQAQQRARQWNLGERATFAVRDMTATGLSVESLDGAMSVDALWLVPDKLAAVQEWARIIKQSGRLVFTTWEMA